MTSIARRISEQRENLILAQAKPYLEDGEEVVGWVRSRRVGGRGEGFVFLTPKRCAVVWTSRNQDPTIFMWTEIITWGVVPDTRGGPILGIETKHGTCTVQLRAATSAMADRVSRFIEDFSANAPFAREPMSMAHQGATFEPVTHVDVLSMPMSVGEKVKRVLITILGATLVVGGIVLTPLPGPWSLPIVIAGLAVLSQEYDWAKDAREWVRNKSKQVAEKLKARRSPTE